MALWAILRGGGDLASGVAARLLRIGFQVIVLELPQPLVVRRTVSFASAVFDEHIQIEDLTGRLAANIDDARVIAKSGDVAVLIDPDGDTIARLQQGLSDNERLVVVDGCMRKQHPGPLPVRPTLLVGLGPGFTPGVDCDAVVETNRGYCLGRVIRQGECEPDTGIPEKVCGHGADRVLHAPATGRLKAYVQIGEQVKAGQVIAEVTGLLVLAPFDGVLRGLIRPGLDVSKGLKIGDVDPRGNPKYCFFISDKALAIGGGVIEAVLSQPDIRRFLA